MGAGSFHAAGVGLAVSDHLACAEGASNKDVAAQLGSTPHAVGRWRARFVQYRIAGLGDLSALCTAGIGPRSSRSSWLNLVERWFAELTNKQIRRGVHRSVQALEKDIRNWIAAWKPTRSPKPYVWTKTADEILERRQLSEQDS